MAEIDYEHDETEREASPGKAAATPSHRQAADATLGAAASTYH